MTHRLLTVLLLAAIGLGAVAAAASASTSRAAAAVLTDCARHDGALVAAHTGAALRAAERTKASMACRPAIATQQAELTGRRGTEKARAVLIDCAKHGHLTRSYSAATLRRAATGMPSDIRQYTQCPQLVRSARAVAAHRHPRR